MSTKKCSKCGWVYPIAWPGRVCKFCSTPFVGGYCASCKEWADKLNRSNICTACGTRNFAKWSKKRRAYAEARHKEWLDEIKMIPTPYQTLTEEQWLTACVHFKGCAYCGAEDISARHQFIAFKEGGRYCNWNIIPACEQCATAQRRFTNPFLRMDEVLLRDKGTKKRGHDLDKLQSIVAYLHDRMGCI